MSDLNPEAIDAMDDHADWDERVVMWCKVEGCEWSTASLRWDDFTMNPGDISEARRRYAEHFQAAHLK